MVPRDHPLAALGIEAATLRPLGGVMATTWTERRQPRALDPLRDRARSVAQEGGTVLLWSGRAELLLIILAVFLLFILPAGMWYLARVKGERWWRRWWPFRRRGRSVTVVDAPNESSGRSNS